MDHEGPWSWQAIGAPGLVTLREKLGDLEAQSFDQQVSHRGPFKTIPLAHLELPAQRRLTDLRLDDFDDLAEIHVEGEQRAWGLRMNNVIHLLWWDPGHTVCISSKKGN
jgi:hypothetical protein